MLKILVALAMISPTPAPAPAPAADLTAQIQLRSAQLEEVIERYNELREDLATTAAQTRVMTRQIEPLRAQAAEKRASVGRLAAVAYRNNRSLSFNALVDSTGARELIDRMLMLTSYTREREREIGDLAATEDRYASVQRTLEALVDQQKHQQEQLVAERLKIEGQIAELKEIRARAPGSSRSSAAFSPPKVSGNTEKVISFALRQVGKDYEWGGEGPGGFDCSGLVKAAFQVAGISLPHQSARQRQRTVGITRDQLRPGDLVFFYKDLHHVGIYLGEGKMVHAPTFGEKVRVDPIDEMPVNSYGRIQTNQ